MKSNLDQFFKTDESLEENGKWCEVSEETKFLLKPFRSENPAMKQAMATHFKPHARQLALDNMDPKKEREILTKVFVQVSMVDWEGVKIDGHVQPFDREKAITLLNRLPNLFNHLKDFAADYANYRESEDPELTDDVGNS